MNDEGVVELHPQGGIVGRSSMSASLTVEPAAVPSEEEVETLAIRPNPQRIAPDFERHLYWSKLPNGTWAAFVYDDDDNLVDGGIGDSQDDAILSIYRSLQGDP